MTIRLIAWFMNWMNARRRAIDLDILWPICKERARDMDRAKAAFAVHAFNDEAWLSLGHEGIVSTIDGLK